MKRNTILLLICYTLLTTILNSCQTKQAESETVNGIVGKWEYFKTVNSDGTEVSDAIHTEHYYDNGSLLWVRMTLNTNSVYSLYDSSDKLKDAFMYCYAGIASYEIDEENNMLSWTDKASSDPDNIGETHKVKFEIDGDTLIFFGENVTLYFKRGKD